MTQQLTLKQQALKIYLEDQNCSEDEITEALEDYDDEDRYFVNGEELLILFDDEADEYVQDHILESLWAFNPDFIAHHVHESRVDDYNELIKSIQTIQEQCEGANSAIKAMIDDLGDFIQDAVSSDGRGHFLCSYDGEEYETCIKVEEKLENTKGHPTFVAAKHFIYIYRA